MRIVAKTDIGLQRSENQDNYRAGEQPDGTVWALVCDGMGGAQGGLLAATLACDHLEQAFTQNIDTLKTPAAVRKFLFRVTDEANTVIHTRARQDPAVHGMGTTMVCVVARGGLLQIVHVGDSRAYLYAEGALGRLTKDHSMVQELIEQGTITEQEASTHPHKNLITRALGVGANVDVDYGEAQLCEGDIVLLCTDGLTNCVSDDEIADTLGAVPFDAAADALVQKALDADGLDNITVLLAGALPAED